jgi:hypothetical protein
VDKILSTLRFVYLRDEYDKVENREHKVAKDEDTEKMILRSKTTEQK